MHPELEFALSLADTADAFTLPRFEAADFTLGWKDDRTEVTEADRGAEELLAERIRTERPDHGFFGEEHGLQGNADSPWRWIVDPIDGTSGFVRGMPIWATLIALMNDETGVEVAVVSAPALARRWWASLGDGAFANGRRCQVSDVAALPHAQVSITLSDGWEAAGKTTTLVEIAQEARRGRGVGDFWQHCLVAEGALDVAIDAVGVALYDVVAVQLVVEEAGGRCTDRHGEPPRGDHAAISTNGVLHDEIIARLR
jgi:histidinol-phosphatase